MNALELLTAQHDEIEELFDQIQSSKSSRYTAELFMDLADKLGAHAKIEETIFYPAVLARQTEDILESAEEHRTIKRALAELLMLDSDDDHFDTKLAIMKEQVEQHARYDEETELFPKIRALFDADELDALGDEMLARYHDLLGFHPTGRAVVHESHAASAR